MDNFLKEIELEGAHVWKCFQRGCHFVATEVEKFCPVCGHPFNGETVRQATAEDTQTLKLAPSTQVPEPEESEKTKETTETPEDSDVQEPGQDAPNNDHPAAPEPPAHP
jgi:hypothetical protein